MPAAEHLVLEGVDEIESGVMVRVRGKETPRCPACSSSQVSYHSCYDRTMRDLPWQGKPVRIRLRARRFRCQNTSCGRKIFAERLPEVAAPRARETVRLCEVIGLVGYALGGLPGSRILSRLGMPRSDDTVLRRIKTQGRGRKEPKVRVLGVDDWAWRKRQNYGTMVMDLEQRQVIDLLAVRSAASFADWLQAHPGVEIITRDRSGLYADGGRQGAPSAVQITDRYHLMSNLSEAVEGDIQQLQVQACADLPGQGESGSFNAVPLVLPASTILFQADGPQVGVVNSQSRVELRKVSLGHDFGDTIEVLTGVRPADAVIANPPDSLTNGMRVALQSASVPSTSAHAKGN